jgi:hypothetical protein
MRGRGNGMGDSIKARLDNTLALAIWHHHQYCHDNFPDYDLKAMILKMAEATQVFWSKLGTYIDDEHSTLTLFKLISKHILMLLLNQVVQIWEDVFEPWCMVASVDVKNNKGVRSPFKVRKDNISSLVAEYPNKGSMR